MRAGGRAGGSLERADAAHVTPPSPSPSLLPPQSQSQSQSQSPSPPLARHSFYLQVRDAAKARGLERRIATLGGVIEIFLVKSVTHVVTDDPRCGSVSKTYHGSSVQKSADTIDRSVSPVPVKWSGGQRGVGYRSRTDAMLESVSRIPQSQTPTTLQQARLWHIPIWTLKKVENFLNNISTKVQKKINTGGRILKGTFIKFESLDRRNRAIFKEFPEWPQINLMKENFGSPFVLLDQKAIKPEITTKQEVKIANANAVADNDNLIFNNTKSHKDLSEDRRLRMTRKARLRVKERIENPPKQNGYCEICRTSYSILSDHERTTAHINFTKNCSNFLSLDCLINEGIDVESFLKMNKSNMPNPCLERRSLRNIIKLNQETETQSVQKQLQVMCNGNTDAICKQVSPRENRKNNNLNEQSVVTQSHFSPSTAGNNGHYLRSKGSGSADNDKMSPRDSKRELLRNGSISPRINADKSESKINGKIDEKEKLRYSHLFKGRKPRSIRYRRPSPDSNPPPPDNQTYYKVVGMSTKLRSSNNFTTIHKEVEPAPPPTRHCNGDTDTGLVVKFRRVRRSELSVLSDEAENFMFPKKDDSDTTEDEVETSHYSNNPTSSEILTSPNAPGLSCKIKEEVLSGDDLSQDSYNSDCVRRKGRRHTKTVPFANRESPFYNIETPESRPRQQSCSASPDNVQNKTDPNIAAAEKNVEKDVEKPPQPPDPCSSQSQDKCLRWEDGRLKVSPEVESLTYTFEQVPTYEPWYETFRRQDEGRENSKSIAQYLGYYWKSPILPYEMGFLPPLKPNCCSLSQIKKPVESKPGPARLYGTRGMKRKKSKLETIHSLSKNPRKSPREHASTLAILGSLIHKKKNKLSSSDDSKSLQSITEEDISSDIPFLLKMPEIHVSEETKKLEEFFSDLYDDVEDYDSLIDNLDLSVKIEKPGKPNVLDLLQNYDQCESIEKTVKEIQDTMQQRSANQRKRKGYKFKKKNKTGWPAKKRIQAKKESAAASAVEDADSTGNVSVLEEVGVESAPENPMVLEGETSVSTDKLNQITNNCVDNVKNQNVNYLVLENNENSITSFSDADEKVSDSSTKCKITDTDLSNNSEEENLSNNVDLNSSKLCDSTECGLSSDRIISCVEEKSHGSSHDSVEMQPVVRVQKIDSKTINARGARKLRSSGSQRRLRRHLHR